MNAATQGFRLKFVVIAVAAIGALAGMLLVAQASSPIVGEAHAGSANCQYNPDDCIKPPPTDCHDTNTCPVGHDKEPTGNEGGGGGELPFTGYPLTPLILLLLLLLAGGLTIRAYLGARGRIQARHATAGNLPLD